MRLELRFVGLMACLVAADDCLSRGDKHLGLSHWLWVIAAVAFVFNGARMMVEGRHA